MAFRSPSLLSWSRAEHLGSGEEAWAVVKGGSEQNRDLAGVLIGCRFKSTGSGVTQACVQILALPLPGCVTQGKSLELSGPQFPHL